MTPNKAPASFKSIFLRLSVSYTLLAFILTLLSVVLLYYALSHLVHQDNKEFLRSEVNTLANIIDQASFPLGKNSNLYQEIVLEPTTSKYHYFVRLIDENGNVSLQTPEMDETVPSHLFPPLKKSESVSSVATVNLSNNREYSLLTAFYKKIGKRLIIQIAIDSSKQKQLILTYQRILIIILIVNILLSLAVGFYVSKNGLKPLRTLNRLLSDIDVDKLHQRLLPEDWPKELQQTANNLNAMLARIESSFTRLKQFSSELAHEMRTPINTMICQIEVSLNKDRTKKEYYNALLSSLEDCQKLSSLIDDMLFIAKSTHPEYTLHRETIEIRPLIDSLIEYLTLLADEKKITITVSGSGQVYADVKLLKRALNNVINNSINYSAEGQAIEINITSSTDVTTIQINDQGIGIPQADLPHLFNRFYRVDKSRSRAEGGTGLGLTIVKSIIDLHHGNISITSQPQKGTSVTIKLPSHKQSLSDHKSDKIVI